MPYKSQVESRAQVAHAKRELMKSLEAAGHPMDEFSSVQAFASAVWEAFSMKRQGRESTMGFFMRVVAAHPAYEAPKFAGEVVEPFVVDLMHRPAYVPKRSANPRADMIADLPHLVSMGGVGNGREDHSKFIRGK